MKKCSACGQPKRRTAFYVDKRYKDGLRGICKSCQYRQNQKYRFSWEEQNKEHLNLWFRNHNYKRRYGITVEDYNEMFEQQGGECGICHLMVPLQVDHDHNTGQVRGLLCATCNKAVGLFHNETAVLSEAIRYLTFGPKNVKIVRIQ